MDQNLTEVKFAVRDGAQPHAENCRARACDGYRQRIGPCGWSTSVGSRRSARERFIGGSSAIN